MLLLASAVKLHELQQYNDNKKGQVQFNNIKALVTALLE